MTFSAGASAPTAPLDHLDVPAFSGVYGALKTFSGGWKLESES